MSDGFQNESACTTCQGLCCKAMPGIVYPKDIDGELSDNIMTMLYSGLYAIDWYEGNPAMYYLRPAIKGDGRVYSPSWGGECIFLSTSGCDLQFSDRPRGCRMLGPKPGNISCDAHGHTKKHGAEAWVPFSKILRSAANIVDQEAPDAD